jgi:hypothetical protein
MRATVSVGPPAASGTIKCTGRSGQAPAAVSARAARRETPAAQAAAAEDAIKRRRVSMAGPG